MYTKKDKGINVYLPQFGDKPCSIKKINTGDEIIEVETPSGIMDFFPDGKESEYHELPILSRTPYIQGEPFVCVVERPEPVWEPEHTQPFIAKVNGVYTIATLKSSPALAGEWYVKTMRGAKVGVPVDDVHPISKDIELLGMPAIDFAWLNTMEYLGVNLPDERTTPYPNVQASGKIKVDTPEQSEAVISILVSLGFKDLNPNRNHNGGCWVTWNKAGISLCVISPGVQIDAAIHHLTDFGLSETKPFGPEDDGISIYDQAELEFKVDFYSDRIWAVRHTEDGVFERLVLNPDGTTVTGLVFTREKPEQCPA